ncbi:hypothetical protein PIB30_093326, partial [Stylosanthes scabra]|nr:hypothetical protein [Stylosanthes scabra]
MEIDRVTLELEYAIIVVEKVIWPGIVQQKAKERLLPDPRQIVLKLSNKEKCLLWKQRMSRPPILSSKPYAIIFVRPYLIALFGILSRFANIVLDFNHLNPLDV